MNERNWGDVAEELLLGGPQPGCLVCANCSATHGANGDSDLLELACHAHGIVGQLTTYEELCNCGPNPDGIRVYTDDHWDEDDFWWIDQQALRALSERFAWPEERCFSPLSVRLDDDGYHYITACGATRLLRSRTEWES